MNFNLGDIILSLRGRDKGEHLVIVKQEGKFAFVADGNTRKLKTLKKKNVKHIELVKVAVLKDIAIKIQKGQPVGNERLHKAIKSELQK